MAKAGTITLHTWRGLEGVVVVITPKAYLEDPASTTLCKALLAQCTRGATPPLIEELGALGGDLAPSLTLEAILEATPAVEATTLPLTTTSCPRRERMVNKVGDKSTVYLPLRAQNPGK